MEGWTYGSEKSGYLRASNSRIFVNDTPTSVGEMIEEGVLLRDVMTERRYQLVLAGTVAAADKRLADIVVLALFSMDRMTCTLFRMSKCQAVRTPFSEQKDEKRRRKKPAEISCSY
jgi:hypothetical protein